MVIEQQGGCQEGLSAPHPRGLGRRGCRDPLVLLAETRSRRCAGRQEDTGLSGCLAPSLPVFCGCGARFPQGPRAPRPALCLPALSRGHDQLLGAAGQCCSPSLCGVQPLGSLLQCRIIVWKQKTTKLCGRAAVAHCWLPPPAPLRLVPQHAAVGGCRQPRARLAVLGEMDRAG